MEKNVQTGVQSFDGVISNNYYYVDKTDLIEELVKKPLTVHLFTRPRRFGKSLTLSMLDCFFNIEYRGNDWFDGLKVSECGICDEHKNAHPVMMMDFKGLGTTYDSFVRGMRNRMSSLFRSFDKEFYDGLNESDSKMFRSIRNLESDEETLIESPFFLSTLLHERYGKRVVILVDEYDDPLHNTHEDPDSQKRILGFMKRMLTTVLKGNKHMEYGVITGVMQIAKENIFSGLNNLHVNNIFSKEFDEKFGFTGKEVMDMCTYFGHPDKYGEIKEWYDGYRFGDAEIYNPWSVLSYIEKDFTPGKYWAGTSGNMIIPDLLRTADKGIWDTLESFGRGESSAQPLDDAITFDDIRRYNDAKSLYSVMAMTGYLNAIPNDDLYDISIPNKEMHRIFGGMILSELGWIVPDDIIGFTDAIIKGKPEKAEFHLKRIMMGVTSVRIMNSEHEHQCFITGLLVILNGMYKVDMDRENGEGYYDILVERRRGNGANALIEIKKVDSDREGEGDRLAAEALAQIKTRSYAYGIKGRTFLYGIAFKVKSPTIHCEVVEIRST